MLLKLATIVVTVVVGVFRQDQAKFWPFCDVSLKCSAVNILLLLLLLLQLYSSFGFTARSTAPVGDSTARCKKYDYDYYYLEADDAAADDDEDVVVL